MIRNSVSIVIPIKNGMNYLPQVFQALETLDYDSSFEVLCIDSGSRDGSIELVRDYGYTLLEIKPEEFGHGRTRNFGASQSQSEFIVFLTHDAIPAHAQWLSELIRPMRDDARVAGVFSRHRAHYGADPFTCHELDQGFENLKPFPVVEIDDPARYRDDILLRQIYHFFSDNSSALRRSVWETHPLPEVDFAEDQIWANTILEAGFKKAYAHNSVIRHSHAFGPYETMRRSFDESRAFRKLFGYQLCKSRQELFKSAIYLIRRDMGLAIRNGWAFKHPWITLSRLGQAVTKPLGHYLGARAEMSQGWQDHLSRDQWVKQTT